MEPTEPVPCDHEWTDDYILAGETGVMTHCIKCKKEKVIPRSEYDARGGYGVNPAQERFRLG